MDNKIVELYREASESIGIENLTILHQIETQESLSGIIEAGIYTLVNGVPLSSDVRSTLDSEVTRLQAEYDANQYQRDRQYPSIGDQLDMLFHAIEAGTLDTTSEFFTTLKAVKDAHPKPV